MYSILLLNNKEWWVSSTVFERLFEAALAMGEVGPTLAYWRDIAAGSGGFNFLDSEKDVVEALTDGLRRAAERELGLLGKGPLSGVDEGYRRGLVDLVALAPDPSRPSAVQSRHDAPP